MLDHKASQYSHQAKPLPDHWEGSKEHLTQTKKSPSPHHSESNFVAQSGKKKDQPTNLHEFVVNAFLFGYIILVGSFFFLDLVCRMFRCLRESWHKMANLDPGNKTSGIIPSNFGNCQSWKKKHWIPFLPQSWKWKITTIKETDFRDGTYFSFPWIMGGKSSTTRIYWKLPPCWESFQQFWEVPTRKKSCLEELEIASLLDLRDDCRPIDVTQTCPGAMGNITCWSKIPPKASREKPKSKKQIVVGSLVNQKKTLKPYWSFMQGSEISESKSLRV